MTIGTSVDRALEILRSGGLVGIPTETVYGLAADASNPDAVRRVFAAKGRPPDHPLIVHIADAEQLTEWATEVPPAAAVLAETCWPGPLTLLLPKAAHVLDLVTGGRPTVGVRVPAHPLTTELLTRFGGGLAAPSANLFGKVSPTTAEHVHQDLGTLVDYVLDGGHCPVGVESTIVDCTVDPPQILRPGGIPSEQVAALLDGRIAAPSGPSRAAGMLASHYAPSARVLLVDSSAAALSRAAQLADAVVIDRTDNLVEYARSLYADLRRADDMGAAVIIAVMPPSGGLGHAIRDRLTKAAH
ncbi:MAG: threonylcarbamoyl-AMP synthase [Actinobacteria bacterium]|jgi:L-threonylcarbamoyladenylate synthase|uniref:Threonylcarbamoyl-AMP synthase n=1 Tax=freshwater metagenome TaxID=449393 RepID=A0A6J6AAR6_9ZZZZ|nr:threonylcarbamoyl-AMP synthase [Actinomycetota bacterium]MSW78116.1 threonylcarbamoyl-AMP synthase [Actinomycetota bacterium]MSX92922.1 threonylcarbamoyl-AMP synthase [Actinomycetota bacterium]MSZ83327.1 threonylcarbamoyl-AMP synthase [Actinomycetota bacterium]MTB18566.1 threonylcarbamoyl-AMP synthase [Actinomycetota bacterium]